MGAPYVRSVVAIPGAPVPAWVYYRYDDNPYNYQALDSSIGGRIKGFFAEVLALF